MFSRNDALRLLAQHRTADVLVVSIMSAAWEWPHFSPDDDLHFPVRGAMGQAASVGLGLALARPDKRVWILNGDGSQLMHMGSMASIADAGAKNIVLFVFENDSYEITGGQRIPLAGRVDFATAAKGMGIKNSYNFEDYETFEAKLPEILRQEGPTFVNLKVVKGESVPQKKPNMVEETRKFKAAMEALR